MYFTYIGVNRELLLQVQQNTYYFFFRLWPGRRAEADGSREAGRKRTQVLPGPTSDLPADHRRFSVWSGQNAGRGAGRPGGTDRPGRL